MLIVQWPWFTSSNRIGKRCKKINTTIRVLSFGNANTLFKCTCTTVSFHYSKPSTRKFRRWVLYSNPSRLTMDWSFCFFFCIFTWLSLNCHVDRHCSPRTFLVIFQQAILYSIHVLILRRTMLIFARMANWLMESGTNCRSRLVQYIRNVEFKFKKNLLTLIDRAPFYCFRTLKP